MSYAFKKKSVTMTAINNVSKILNIDELGELIKSKQKEANREFVDEMNGRLIEQLKYKLIPEIKDVINDSLSKIGINYKEEFKIRKVFDHCTDCLERSRKRKDTLDTNIVNSIFKFGSFIVLWFFTAIAGGFLFSNKFINLIK